MIWTFLKTNKKHPTQFFLLSFLVIDVFSKPAIFVDETEYCSVLSPRSKKTDHIKTKPTTKKPHEETISVQKKFIIQFLKKNSVLFLNITSKYYTTYIPKKNTSTTTNLSNLPHHQPHKFDGTTTFFILKSEKWTVHLFSAAFTAMFIFEDERERMKILKYFILL